MRASRDFPLGVLVVVLANILTTYAGPTAFYFFDKENNNGVRMAFRSDQTKKEYFTGKFPVKWNPNLPTCLVIGDCFEDPGKKEASSVLIKEALLKAERACNIVLVDWHLNAKFDQIRTDWSKKPNEISESLSNDFLIITAGTAYSNCYTSNVPDTAYQVAYFIAWIRQDAKGEGREVIAFVHCLGSQMIGIAAHALFRLGETKIKTIIATDPPSKDTVIQPLLIMDHITYITKESAHRVIIIRTNVGGFGSLYVDGHIIFDINNEYIIIKGEPGVSSELDFIKNGELLKKVQVQPGFSKQNAGRETLFYSHDLAPKFLADQIVNPQIFIYKNENMTLFGEDFPDASIPPKGLLIVLSWKNGQPELLADKGRPLANWDDAIPKFTTDFNVNGFKVVVETPASGDMNLNENLTQRKLLQNPKPPEKANVYLRT